MVKITLNELGAARLLHDDLAHHAGALVGLAVVRVRARGVEGVGHLITGAVQVVLVGDGIRVHTLLEGRHQDENATTSGSYMEVV
jgi:hypothetical protein